MVQYTEILMIKISKEMKIYLDTLNKIYKVKKSYFTRNSILEKLQRDMPEIRKKHKLKNEIKLPF